MQREIDPYTQKGYPLTPSVAATTRTWKVGTGIDAGLGGADFANGKDAAALWSLGLNPLPLQAGSYTATKIEAVLQNLLDGSAAATISEIWFVVLDFKAATNDWTLVASKNLTAVVTKAAAAYNIDASLSNLALTLAAPAAGYAHYYGIAMKYLAADGTAPNYHTLTDGPAIGLQLASSATMTPASGTVGTAGNLFHMDLTLTSSSPKCLLDQALPTLTSGYLLPRCVSHPYWLKLNRVQLVAAKTFVATLYYNSGAAATHVGTVGGGDGAWSMGATAKQTTWDGQTHANCVMRNGGATHYADEYDVGFNFRLTTGATPKVDVLYQNLTFYYASDAYSTGKTYSHRTEYGNPAGTRYNEGDNKYQANTAYPGHVGLAGNITTAGSGYAIASLPCWVILTSNDTPHVDNLQVAPVLRPVLCDSQGVRAYTGSSASPANPMILQNLGAALAANATFSGSMWWFAGYGGARMWSDGGTGALVTRIRSPLYPGYTYGTSPWMGTLGVEWFILGVGYNDFTDVVDAATNQAEATAVNATQDRHMVMCLAMAYAYCLAYFTKWGHSAVVLGLPPTNNASPVHRNALIRQLNRVLSGLAQGHQCLFVSPWRAMNGGTFTTPAFNTAYTTDGIHYDESTGGAVVAALVAQAYTTAQAGLNVLHDREVS